MGIDTESSKAYEKEWWAKKRFAGLSKEEIQKIEEQDREREKAQDEINRHIEAINEDPECKGWTEEKAAEHEEAKKKMLDQIYSD